MHYKYKKYIRNEVAIYSSGRYYLQLTQAELIERGGESLATFNR